MEKTIEKIKARKAQIAGAIVELEDKKWEFKTLEFESRVSVLEAQADLYDSLIEMAEVIMKLQKTN